MQCPNCYNENEEGRTTCKYCGSPLPVSDEVPQQEQTNVVEENNVQDETNYSQQETSYTQQEANENLNVQKYQAEMFSEDIKKPKKEKKKNPKVKKVLIILFILVILVGSVAAGIYYYTTITTPQKIYEKAIDTIMKKSFDDNTVDAKSAQIQAKVKISAPEESILASVNNFTFDTTIGVDLTNETGLLKLKVDKDEQNYIDGTVLADLDHRLAYIGETNIYDKYIRLDIPEEYVSEIESAVDFKALATRDTSAKRSNVKTALQTQINDNINLGTFERSKATISYNGKNKSVRDDVYTLTEGQYKQFLNNMLSSLKDNNTFLQSFDDESDTIVDAIENALDEIKYFKDDELVETPKYFKAHLYTSGIKFDFMGIKLEYVSPIDKEIMDFSICKSGENSYIVVCEENSGEEQKRIEEDITCETLEDGTNKATFVTKYDEKEYTVDVEYKYTLDSGIDSIDLGNVKKVEELTEEDYTQMLGKFAQMPIYNLVTVVTSYIMENGLDFGMNTGINSDTQLPNNIELQENQSYLITSDAKVVVFEVPAAFENNYNGNLYKSYRKNNRIGDRSEVYLNLVSGNNIKKILDEYKSSYDFLFEKEYRTEKDKDGKEIQVEVESKYKDINISEYKEETINDVKYQTLEVSYTSDTKNKIKYYATEFNDDYCFVVRVEDENNIITQSELEKILSITKYLD